MGWSDERVEKLKKLWQEGVSATQIAKQLGGVTRNAVIGKIHRMGLSGRAMPSRPTRTVFKASQAPRRAAAPSPPRRLIEPASMIAAEKVVIPFMDETPGTATVLTLAAHMCKWPIGDPAHEDFSFCGRRADAGPYCAEHHMVAHQELTPAQKARAKSLERYFARQTP